MPRPKVHESNAEKVRAYRERKKAATVRADQECMDLAEAVRELRRAWLRLPVDLRPDDVEFAEPVKGVQLVTALLERMAEGRLFDKPTEECQFSEPGPVMAREVKTRRRKKAES